MTENIFIVGCNRTGTTLLRQILNKSRRIAIAPETHFLRRFSSVGVGKRLEKMGALSDNRNVIRLIDFMYSGREVCGSAYWEWLRKNVDRQMFEEWLLSSDRSDSSIFSLLMQVYADKTKERTENSLILGEKTPTHFYYVPTLLKWFPQAKVIHTFRDPRAIIVSKLKKVKERGREGPKIKFSALPGWLLDPFIDPIEVLHMTKAWFDAARLHIQYEQSYPRSYRLLRFEDLITEPERQIKQICDFLEIPFEREMLEEIYVVGSSYQSRRRGANGFDQRTLERWKDHINPLIRAWFSILGRKHLRRFGYISL
jgi:hypothetical protein